MGRGRAGAAREPRKGLGAHFRASPLREALPYLSHRLPPRSRTCILKAPCSPGIGGGRVLRAQKLERPRGEGWQPGGWTVPSPWRPPPPTHPRRGPIRRAGGAGPRLERASGKAPGGRAHGVGEDVGGRPPLRPPSLFLGGGARPRRPAPPRPEWAGRLGLRSWAGGGPPPALPEPEERPARRPPTQRW